MNFQPNQTLQVRQLIIHNSLHYSKKKHSCIDHLPSVNATGIFSK